MIATSLISIGNSRGIRIPKPFLNACGMVNDIIISLQGNSIVITPQKKQLREGWKEDAKKISQEKPDLFFSGNNDFDLSYWEWK